MKESLFRTGLPHKVVSSPNYYYRGPGLPGPWVSVYTNTPNDGFEQPISDDEFYEPAARPQEGHTTRYNTWCDSDEISEGRPQEGHTARYNTWCDSDEISDGSSNPYGAPEYADAYHSSQEEDGFSVGVPHAKDILSLEQQVDLASPFVESVQKRLHMNFFHVSRLSRGDTSVQQVDNYLIKYLLILCEILTGPGNGGGLNRPYNPKRTKRPAGKARVLGKRPWKNSKASGYGKVGTFQSVRRLVSNLRNTQPSEEFSQRMNVPSKLFRRKLTTLYKRNNSTPNLLAVLRIVYTMEQIYGLKCPYRAPKYYLGARSSSLKFVRLALNWVYNLPSSAPTATSSSPGNIGIKSRFGPHITCAPEIWSLLVTSAGTGSPLVQHPLTKSVKRVN